MSEAYFSNCQFDIVYNLKRVSKKNEKASIRKVDLIKGIRIKTKENFVINIHFRRLKLV